jgi:hypothetical protein
MMVAKVVVFRSSRARALAPWKKGFEAGLLSDEVQR